MLLDPRLRRLTTYLYVQDLLKGADVLDVGTAGEMELLQARGAKSVRAVAADQLELLPPGFDVIFALDLPPVASEVRALAEHLRRLLKPTGALVLAVPSRDRPGARSGLSYYELADLLEPLFPSVKMVGQAPFAGATLVEYGVADPDPVLDGTLVPKGERVEWYVAVGGPKREGSRGYGVMQVPLGDVAALPSERRVAPPADAKKAGPPAPVVAKPTPAAPAPAPLVQDAELKAQLQAAHEGKAELQDFVLRLKAELAEREAFAAEHAEERRELSLLRETARKAEARAAAAEAAERQTRKQLAEAQGTLTRLRAGQPLLSSVALPPPEPSVDVAALQAELEKWKSKESDARAEAWKALKQRADAEQQAAEVREDTVRKLKDARKLASVELTRATEEAMKKAVSLKEELARTERERKEMLAEVKQLRGESEARAGELEALRRQAEERAGELEALRRQAEERAGELEALRRQAEERAGELEALRRQAEEERAALQRELEALRERPAAREGLAASAEASDWTPHEWASSASSQAATTPALDEETRARVAQLERELVNADAIAAADRARTAQLLADMEREAQERADGAVRLRHALRDREREVAALRHELSERDAQLTALEQRSPPSDEVERLEAELATTRGRLGGVLQELARKEAQVERAAAAAAHERARAERLMADQRTIDGSAQAARARAAESERQLDVARERLGRLELELRGEAERVGALEQAVRRAADHARNNGHNA